ADQLRHVYNGDLLAFQVRRAGRLAAVIGLRDRHARRVVAGERVGGQVVAAGPWRIRERRAPAGESEADGQHHHFSHHCSPPWGAGLPTAGPTPSSQPQALPSRLRRLLSRIAAISTIPITTIV